MAKWRAKWRDQLVYPITVPCFNVAMASSPGRRALRMQSLGTHLRRDAEIQTRAMMLRNDTDLDVVYLNEREFEIATGRSIGRSRLPGWHGLLRWRGRDNTIMH